MAVENTDYIDGLDPTKPDGSSPKSEGDDHLRLLKNVLQKCFSGFAGDVLLAASETQGATANDYVLTIAPAPTAYTANTLVVFEATHANTGAATVQVAGLSAVALVNPEGTAVRANAITADCAAMAIFDGTNFRLLAGNSQAIYDYVDQTQFQSALPGQASQAGKFLATDGTNAAWTAIPTYTKVSLGLGNVDNTSDSAKPISAATQTALNAKANLNGVTFTGPIAAPQITSMGSTYAGNGSALLDASGNVYGTVWGGYLSTYLGSQFSSLNSAINSKQPAGSYVGNTFSAPIALGWTGSSITTSVGSSGTGELWTNLNFNPSSKQNAGNYIRSPDANSIQLLWRPGASPSLGVYINGLDVGELKVT